MTWQQDDSEVCTVIHPVAVGVRLDVLTVQGNDPVRSFQGLAHDVRILAVRWLERHYKLSAEHAAYIGAELARAAILGPNYVQE